MSCFAARSSNFIVEPDKLTNFVLCSSLVEVRNLKSVCYIIDMTFYFIIYSPRSPSFPLQGVFLLQLACGQLRVPIKQLPKHKHRSYLILSHVGNTQVPNNCRVKEDRTIYLNDRSMKIKKAKSQPPPQHKLLNRYEGVKFTPKCSFHCFAKKRN